MLPATLVAANAAARAPGDRPGQPVSVVYGGAHLFRPDLAPRLGALATHALQTWAPDAATFGAVFDLPPALAERVLPRVRTRLATRPVDDVRADFEDGYGARPDAEEDAHATAVGEALARGRADGLLPPRVGIRLKPLTNELGTRALRTLDRVLAAAGPLPTGFVVTLAKATVPEQVAVLVDHLPADVPVELMIETPTALLDASGRCPIPALVAAGRGRVSACHLGAYDLTAAAGVTAAHQSLGHPLNDLARGLLKLALAQTGVWVADGATTTLPVPLHKGDRLPPEALAENRAAVHHAWRLAAADVRRSLHQGFDQGWDLHPAQLVSRYAAVFGFFLDALPAAAARLRNFVDRAAQATRVGTVFDDAATGQGLLNFFLRGLDTGALTPEEAAAAGLTPAELATRSFAAIQRGRA